MTNSLLIEQLDSAIGVLIAHPNSQEPCANEAIRELMTVARELRYLPRPEFKATLKADIEEQARAMSAAHLHLVFDKEEECGAAPLPTIFGNVDGNTYPVHRANFAASFLLHVAALALILSSGFLVGKHPLRSQGSTVALLNEPSAYVLPSARDNSGGGGGGGDRDRLRASKGTAPRFAREQLTPPAIVVRNPDPKLSREATVAGPPQLTLPQPGQTGDPLASVLAPPSNGVGSGGGIGSGNGGGVGIGSGPGVGPGIGGGFGGGVYRVGGGVSAPHAIYSPVPEYSDEARKTKHQGTVVVQAIIGVDGLPRDLHVQRSLGMGLDEKALEAVRKWRFEPAMKDGSPVNVRVSIEVNFHLY
jgi:TonB family protein